MAPLLADAEFPSLRAALEVVLTHKYTRVPQTAGTEDTWGTTPSASGTAVAGVACLYDDDERAVRDEAGVTLVSVPTLTVSATDPLKVGDQVSAITDQLGDVLLAGPLRVERRRDRAAGLGASLIAVWELRAADVVRS